MESDREIEKAKKELIRINEEMLRQSSRKLPMPKEESPETPTLYVFRHGQSEDNENFLFSGWRDSPLSPTGVKQAEILGKKLKSKRIDLGIHSRLQRSLNTLDIVLRCLKNVAGLKKERDDRIIERSYGILQGTSKAELFLTNRPLYEKYHRAYNFPAEDGESLKMVQQRVVPFCEELVERMKREKINVAVSAHSNSMRILRMYFEKLTVAQMQEIEDPLAQDYCSYVIGPGKS